jgi:hypothetical protein
MPGGFSKDGGGRRVRGTCRSPTPWRKPAWSVESARNWAGPNKNVSDLKVSYGHPGPRIMKSRAGIRYFGDLFENPTELDGFWGSCFSLTRVARSGQACFVFDV